MLIRRVVDDKVEDYTDFILVARRYELFHVGKSTEWWMHVFVVRDIVTIVNWFALIDLVRMNCKATSRTHWRCEHRRNPNNIDSKVFEITDL